MIVKKKEALNVLGKFDMSLSGKKERIAKLYYKSIFILSTAVPKGSGDMICTDKFRKQLHLCQEQLRDAVTCPFGKDEFIAKLREKAIIPSTL